MNTIKKKLESFLDKKVTFEYAGPDLPSGEIGAQEVKGEIKNIGIDTFKIDIPGYPDTTLTISDIIDGTIKNL